MTKLQKKAYAIYKRTGVIPKNIDRPFIQNMTISQTEEYILRCNSLPDAGLIKLETYDEPIQLEELTTEEKNNWKPESEWGGIWEFNIAGMELYEKNEGVRLTEEYLGAPNPDVGDILSDAFIKELLGD